MKENPLITVIVPVYKVEPYLQRCIDSVLAQTYQNLEIILVDDGSPDNCGNICDNYAKMDYRIKVVHKTNGGLSDARNAGLNIMKGQYVGFVDSDDWIEPQMYECLLDLLTYFETDIAFGGVSDDVETNGKVESVKKSNYGTQPFAEDTVDAMKRFFHGSWAAWDKLYKAELFENVRYPIGEINEDEAIVLQLLSQCETVCYTNEVLYHYVKRKDGSSITTNPFSEKKLDWVKHCADNYNYIREYYPELMMDAIIRYRKSIIWALTEIALSNNIKKFSTAIKRLMTELKINKKLFLKAPFGYIQEKIKIFILYYGGFGLYRIIIKTTRFYK